MMAVHQPAQNAMVMLHEISPRRTWGMREVALSLLAVAYPFHFYAQGPAEIFDLSLGDAIIAIVVVGFCIRVMWGRFSLPQYIKPVMAFMLVAFASLLVPLLRPALDSSFFTPGVGFVELVKVVASACWMIACYVLLRRDPLGGIRIFGIVSVLIATVFAVLTVHESLVLPGTRPSGPFENENLYANYLTLNLLLALLLARHDGAGGSWGKVWTPARVSVPILLVGILATGSRGALIGAAVALPLAFKWRLPHRLSLTRAAAISITLVLSGYGLLTFWQSNPFIAERVSSIVTGEGPNIVVREDLWEAAYGAFLTFPLLGIGYHQFPQYAEAVYGLRPTVPHNTYLSIAAELGLIGLFAFFWLLAAVIRDGLRMARTLSTEVPRVLVMCVLATLVQGFFADVEHYRSLWIAFGMLAALRTRFADDAWPSPVRGG